MSVELFWARALFIKKLDYNNILKLHDIENTQGHAVLPYEIRQKFGLDIEYALTQREHDYLIEMLNRARARNTSETGERMTDLDYLHSWDFSVSHIKDNEWTSWRQATPGKKAMAEEAE